MRTLKQVLEAFLRHDVASSEDFVFEPASGTVAVYRDDVILEIRYATANAWPFPDERSALQCLGRLTDSPTPGCVGIVSSGDSLSVATGSDQPDLHLSSDLMGTQLGIEEVAMCLDAWSEGELVGIVTERFDVVDGIRRVDAVVDWRPFALDLVTSRFDASTEAPRVPGVR